MFDYEMPAGYGDAQEAIDRIGLLEHLTKDLQQQINDLVSIINTLTSHVRDLERR